MGIFANEIDMAALTIAFIALFIFRPWFTLSGTLSASDWPYLFRESIRTFSWMPEPRFLWLAPYYQIVAKFFVGNLGMPWFLFERLFWFWPWILVSFFSAKKLTNSVLGGFIYTTNTYALMLVGGGQMGVAWAYALAPLVLVNPWFLPIQVMFDPRLALLTILVSLRKNIKSLIAPVVATIFIHSYWWIQVLKNPTILSTQFQEATSGAVKYLSFSSFSNALSLLHPNWPENIFGKVFFQRPEFLILPILAFASLLFAKKKAESTFFALLSLVGTFLAKGVNEPFGGVYLWLFNHVPGFTLFRDPTKFYLFIALGYSVLIPISLKELVSTIKKKAVTFKFLHTKYFILYAFLLFWAFTLREAITGRLTGTFQPVQVPVEYVKLKDFLVADTTSFQTGWYPLVSRFAFSSIRHPAVAVSSIDQKLLTNKTIKYLIVPLDVRGEIFVTDRHYDFIKHQEAIYQLSQVSWLRRLSDFKELAVFQVL